MGDKVVRPVNTSPDWELVSHAVAGDDAAFATLVQRHERSVVYFCFRMVGSREDAEDLAEDLAQESFIRLYARLGRLRPRAKFTTYLFAVARNLSLNFVRDQRRRGRDVTGPLDRVSEQASARGRPDRAAQLDEAAALIERALAGFSTEHREVLLLRDLQGFEYAAIGRIIRRGPGTVKSRLARARDALRRRLTELGGLGL